MNLNQLAEFTNVCASFVVLVAALGSAAIIGALSCRTVVAIMDWRP